jgi:glutathione S-transferase
MAKYKLSYFDIAASRGEECRLAFSVAGVDFEDHRVRHDEWRDLKPKTPFGSLPVLELEGKPPISQCNAILTYIGRRYGLLPDDAWEAARIESLLCAAEDLRGAVGTTFGIKDPEELKRRRHALVEGPIKAWAKNTEQQIRGPFASGTELGVADLKLFIVAGWFAKGVLDHVPTDVLADYPKLQALCQAVKKHPKVVEWYARAS